MPKDTIPDEVIVPLLDAGLPDGEIAKKTGLHRSAIRHRRRRVGRPQRYVRLSSVAAIEPIVRRMFNEGATDRQILDALDLPRGVRVDQVRYYRRMLGLKRQDAPPTPITEAEFKAVSALAEEGISSAEICSRLGMGATRLRNLCLKFNLEIDGTKKRVAIPSDEAERWAKALRGRSYESWAIRRAVGFKGLPPATHIYCECTAAMAAL